MKLLHEFADELQAAILNEKNMLGRRGCSRFEDYHYACGKIAGIDYALTSLLNLLKTTPKEER